MKTRLWGMVLLVFMAMWTVSAMAAVDDTLDIEVKDKKPIPVDDQVKIDTLDNGLTYYIRTNEKPENRAEVWLVVDAGSVLEDDDQQGLAHFIEHMAFNGTTNFEKQELVDYLESLGIRFGPDLNASTSFDQTLYKLQIPTDSLAIVQTTFQILEDWAHQISLDPEEIDKERGVIKEEWRVRRGAEMRMMDEQFPVLFKGSRYANRLPIGQMAVVDTAHYETFNRYYNDWYRPDLMAVIAVGDFDPKMIENLIKEHFSRLKPHDDPRERPEYEVPKHEETLFAIATDPEATRTSVSVFYKLDKSKREKMGDYKHEMTEYLFNMMLNERLKELTKKPEPPFLYGYSYKGGFIRPIETYILSAGVKETQIQSGLEALLTEAVRASRHGFTASELERAKSELLREMEQEYNERDKTESRNYVYQYINHFLDDDPIPSIAAELAMAREYVPQIELADVNNLANQWMTNDNRVITVSAPQKPDITIPTEDELLDVFGLVAEKDIQPYEDTVTDEPLMESAPEPVDIVGANEYEALGVTEWELANGVKVVLKPTEFKNDEVLFTAISPGGHSLVSNDNYYSAITASDAIEESGVGSFTSVALDKKLSDKIVEVEPWIDELHEGIAGKAAPADLETMFQLIHLYFTAPRKDAALYASFQARMAGFLENRTARPETALRDTLQVTMAQYHPRSKPWTREIIKEMDLDESYLIYTDRFADASDFIFFFVGNFDLESMKPMIQSYLGTLPATHRVETWRDLGIDPPRGVIEKTVRKGIEPKSQVVLTFSGPFDWTRENRYELSSLVQAMRIKLREQLREDKSGTYGVGIWSVMEQYPDGEYQVNITFGCDPERAEELIDVVFTQIDSLQNEPLDVSYVEKVKEMQRRKRETDLQDNGFWLEILKFYYQHQEDPVDILNYDQLVENLTAADLQSAAQHYLDTANYVEVVLYPEEGKQADTE